jgi:CheY-like chemotaxis protein
MDGISFVKKLRTDARYEKTPIIMITAYADEAAMDESLRKGVSFVLPKPIDFDRLLSLVRFAE